MCLLTLLIQTWSDLGPMLQYGPTVILLGLTLIFILKALPSWKEVKLRELELRTTEVTVRGEEAKALTALSETLRDVAVEQRKATEEQRRATEMIEILQRVNSDASDRLTAAMTAQNERIDRIEKFAVLAQQQENLIGRVGVLETHVQSSGTTAGT